MRFWRESFGDGDGAGGDGFVLVERMKRGERGGDGEGE